LSDAVDTPGPGSYYYDKGIGDGKPKHVIVSRKADPSQTAKDKSQPGPGAYQPSWNFSKKSEPKIGMGTSSRDGFYKPSDAPGPGFYDTRQKLGGPKWGFGSSARTERNSKANEPGPGSYNLPPKFADVPRYAYSSMPLKIHL